jgi:hypothetical protein
VNMYIQEYVCLNENGKMRPVTTILRKGKGWIKEDDRGGELHWEIL